MTDQTDHLAASLGDAAVFRCAVVEVCLTQTRSLGEEEVSHPASGLLWQPMVPGSQPRIYSVKYTRRVPPLLYTTLVARHPFRVTLCLGLGLGLLPADSLTDANCPNEKNVTRVERVYIG